MSAEKKKAQYGAGEKAALGPNPGAREEKWGACTMAEGLVSRQQGGSTATSKSKRRQNRRGKGGGSPTKSDETKSK